MSRPKTKRFSLEQESAPPAKPAPEVPAVALPEYEFITEADQIAALIAAWEYNKMVPLCYDPATGHYWDGVVSFKDPKKLLNYYVRRHRAGDFEKKDYRRG